MTFLIDAGIPFVRKFKELIYEASDGERYKYVITDFIYRLFFHALNLDKGNTVYLPPAGIGHTEGALAMTCESSECARMQGGEK